MTEMRKPREGWYKQLGTYWLLHVNWSRSWDGWGVTSSDGSMTWKIAELSFTRSSKGYPVTSLIFWRLLIRLGHCK